MQIVYYKIAFLSLLESSRAYVLALMTLVLPDSLPALDEPLDLHKTKISNV